MKPDKKSKKSLLPAKQSDSKDIRQELKSKYDIVVAKISELQKVRDIEYKTSCQFRYNGDSKSSVIDISSCTNLRALIEINAFLKMKHAQYVDSAIDLGLKMFPEFTWGGYKVELWQSDIKQRLDVVNSQEEITKLFALKNKMEPLLSEDSKIEQLLAEIG